MRSAFVGILAFAAVTLCVAATPAEAQTGVGVKGGLVIAKLKTAPDSGDVLGERQDFSAGIFIVPNRRAPVTVQFESLYSRRGTSLDADVGSSRVDLQACKLEYSIVSPK